MQHGTCFPQISETWLTVGKTLSQCCISYSIVCNLSQSSTCIKLSALEHIGNYSFCSFMVHSLCVIENGNKHCYCAEKTVVKKSLKKKAVQNQVVSITFFISGCWWCNRKLCLEKWVVSKTKHGSLTTG